MLLVYLCVIILKRFFEKGRLTPSEKIKIIDYMFNNIFQSNLIPVIDA
jgi:hypothetical protein